MKITKKLKLISILTEEIDNRYDDVDKVHFFKAFDVNVHWAGNYNQDEYVDTKGTLHSLENLKLQEIAEELEVATEHIIITPPKNWAKTDNVKAFISHTTKKKVLATRLRDEFKKFNVDCFVAHEDIKPSAEWQDEIDKALQTMDIFISMHTKGFAESFWCQQEVGYAVAKNVKIIPVKFGVDQDPVGFIGKIQALSRGDKTAQVVVKEILEILKTDEKTKYFRSKFENYHDEMISEDEIPF